MMKIVIIAFLSVMAGVTATARAADIADQKERLNSPDYEVRKAVATELLRTGETRPLSKDEIALLLPLYVADPDWRIKVRITAILPFAADKAQVVPPLIAAVGERNEKASGGGNLQIYSCDALAKIGDSRALPAMREWLTFLKSKPKDFTALLDDLIKSTEKSIKEIEGKSKNQDSNKTSEPSVATAPQVQR